MKQQQHYSRLYPPPFLTHTLFPPSQFIDNYTCALATERERNLCYTFLFDFRRRKGKRGSEVRQDGAFFLFLFSSTTSHLPHHCPFPPFFFHTICHINHLKREREREREREKKTGSFSKNRFSRLSKSRNSKKRIYLPPTPSPLKTSSPRAAPTPSTASRRSPAPPRT